MSFEQKGFRKDRKPLGVVNPVDPNTKKINPDAPGRFINLKNDGSQIIPVKPNSAEQNVVLHNTPKNNEKPTDEHDGLVAKERVEPPKDINTRQDPEVVRRLDGTMQRIYEIQMRVEKRGGEKVRQLMQEHVLPMLEKGTLTLSNITRNENDYNDVINNPDRNDSLYMKKQDIFAGKCNDFSQQDLRDMFWVLYGREAE